MKPTRRDKVYNNDNKTLRQFHRANSSKSIEHERTVDAARTMVLTTPLIIAEKRWIGNTYRLFKETIIVYEMKERKQYFSLSSER
jgi:hypothetical protein